MKKWLFLATAWFMLSAVSPFTLPNFQLTVTQTTATITVNGLNSGAMVAPGATLTVAVSNGAGNTNDWMGICNSGVPAANNQCDGPPANYDWDYLNCIKTAQPTTGLTSASCTLTAPSTPGTYVANFFKQNYGILYASATFAVVTAVGGCNDPSAVSGIIPSNFVCDPARSVDFDRVTSLPSIVSTAFFAPDSATGCSGTITHVGYTFDSQGLHGGLTQTGPSTYAWTPYGTMDMGGFTNYAVEYVRNFGPTHGAGNPDFWTTGTDGSTQAQNGHPELDGTPAYANNDFNEFGTADMQLQDGSGNNVIAATAQYSMCPPPGFGPGGPCLPDGNTHTVTKVRNNGQTSVYLDGALVFSLPPPWPVSTNSKDTAAWSSGGGNCSLDQWFMKYVHVFHVP